MIDGLDEADIAEILTEYVSSDAAPIVEAVAGWLVACESIGAWSDWVVQFRCDPFEINAKHAIACINIALREQQLVPNTVYLECDVESGWVRGDKVMPFGILKGAGEPEHEYWRITIYRGYSRNRAEEVLNKKVHKDQTKLFE